LKTEKKGKKIAADIAYKIPKTNGKRKEAKTKSSRLK